MYATDRTDEHGFPRIDFVRAPLRCLRIGLCFCCPVDPGHRRLYFRFDLIADFARSHLMTKMRVQSNSVWKIRS